MPELLLLVQPMLDTVHWKRVPHWLLEELRAGLESSVPSVRQVVLPEIPVPRQAFDPSRDQYVAHKILSTIKEKTDSLANSSLIPLDVLYHPRAKVIALIPADGYVRGMNFIFGLAEVGGRFGMVFLSRLAGSRSLFSERTLKEVLHELGHLIGLDHCSNPACVMSFSNTLADTDAKEAAFCDECLSKVFSWLRALPPIPQLP